MRPLTDNQRLAPVVRGRRGDSKNTMNKEIEQ